MGQIEPREKDNSTREIDNKTRDREIFRNNHESVGVGTLTMAPNLHRNVAAC
jgi:hypothetical protein